MTIKPTPFAAAFLKNSASSSTSFNKKKLFLFDIFFKINSLLVNLNFNGTLIDKVEAKPAAKTTLNDTNLIKLKKPKLLGFKMRRLNSHKSKKTFDKFFLEK